MRKLHFFLILVALSLATSSLWALPTGVVNGKLPGAFSVGNGKKIFFSQGNLQYVGTWQFAEEQWVSFANTQSENHRDLFGWGTGNNPNNTSTVDSDYSEYSEWGNNDITNGGNTDHPGWRAWTNDEKFFLCNTTVDRDVEFSFIDAIIHEVKGKLFFPDGWKNATSNIVTKIKSGKVNTIIDDDWTILENEGAVFLPSTGSRNGTTVYDYTNYGYYWTSTSSGDDQAYYFNNSGPWYRSRGFAVRLVQDAPAAEIDPKPVAKTLYANGDAQELVTAGTAVNGTMQYKLNSGSWTTSIPTATTAGDYTVYYKAVGDATHSDSEESSVVVTINNPLATISNPPTAKSPLIYTGSSLELVNAGSGVSGGTLKYSLDGVNWSEDIPTASALGDYTVYWKVEGDASHSDYIPEPAYIAVSITIPTVSDNADPSTVLSNLYNNGNPSQLLVERIIYRNGEYNTICLPFAVSASELTTSTHPLYGFNNLKTIKGASISGTAPDLSIDIFVEDVTAMEAGKPYLISYPSANENIVNPVFTDITVTETSPGSVTADGITFQGMFAQVHIDPYTNERDEDYLFLGANSQLMWPNNDGKFMRGFRAYFIIDRTVITPAAAPSGTRARFVNAPKQPTSIENTELNTQAQKLLENGQLIILKNGIKYNAQGQVLK